MTPAEVAALILAAAALLTSVAQLLVAFSTHAKVDTQVHQTNGLTAELVQLNRSLGQAEGRAETTPPAALVEPGAPGHT